MTINPARQYSAVLCVRRSDPPTTLSMWSILRAWVTLRAIALREPLRDSVLLRPGEKVAGTVWGDRVPTACFPIRISKRLLQTLPMGQADSLQEPRQIALCPLIEHHVPMMGHQAVSQNPHGHKIQAFFHDGDEVRGNAGQQAHFPSLHIVASSPGA